MDFKSDLKHAIFALILTIFTFLIDSVILYVIISCLLFFVMPQSAFTILLFAGVVLYTIFFEGIRLTFLKEFTNIKDGVYTKNKCN